MKNLRVAGIVRESIVDGPGLRFVIFSQGCPHNCEGCHNPATHSVSGGYDMAVEDILKLLDESPIIQGVTFSGGEPFLQPEVFNIIAEEVRDRGLNILCYSGYTFEQLVKRGESDGNVSSLLEKIDILIDGPFEKDLKDLTLKFRGSSNQRIIDVKSSLEKGNVVLKNI